MSDKNNTSEITADILSEGIELETITSTWDKIIEFCGGTFWNLDAAYQVAMIVGAFLLGGVLYKLICIRLTPRIEQSKLSPRLKEIATTTKALLYPLISLIILSIANIIATAGPLTLDTALSAGVAKVIMAWIIIRFFAQFITNSAVRNIFSTLIWICAALSIFGVLGQALAALDSIGFDIGESRISALIVLKSLLSIFVLLYLALFGAGFAERKLYEVKSLTRSSQVLIGKVVRVFLIVCALLIGVTSAGIDLSLFAVFGGAIGLGIGFGLQKGISNLFSGMLLLIDRSIKPGDVIEIPDIGTFGWVNNMAARYTEIVTRDNKSYLIPNEDFITQRVINWSHGNSLIRIEVTFGVSYKHDPHEIRALAVAATTDCDPRICKNPEPVCHLTEFADSSLNFTLRFWIKDAEKGITNIRGSVMLALWDTFKDNNIEIPYPHREVYLHEPPQEKPAVKKKA